MGSVFASERGVVDDEEWLVDHGRGGQAGARDDVPVQVGPVA